MIHYWIRVIGPLPAQGKSVIVAEALCTLRQ